MKKNIVLLSLCATFTLSANADTFGFEVGAAAWNANISGDFSYKGSKIDLEKDLGYDDRNTNFMWATFEHPIPLIPNIKIQHTKVEDSASKNINNNLIFNNKIYTGTVNSSINLNQTDFIAYYEILDNWLNLDLGVNAKYLDTSVSMDSATQSASSKNVKEVIPMLYAKVKFELPFSGLALESDLSYITYDSSEFYDFKGGLVYETNFGLGAIAGYRAEKIKLNDISDVDSDINIKGFYGGLYYHF
ncbi:MAG: TIGR04219 family outer membrane beta-barrel protein [Aliarcobacter sp.]|nr:TIGR04219 family outer membrane beta-barrel protein [Aliarcobacter sp.]